MNSKLEDLRKQIDKCDEELIELLQKRFAITSKVGQLKARSNVQSIDPAREQQQFKRIKKLAEKRNINPDLASKLLRSIIDQVVIDHEAMKLNATSISARDKPSVGIIGMGDFGQLSAKHLNNVCSLKCYDENPKLSSHKLTEVMKCEVVIIAVPLLAIKVVLETIKPLLKPSTILVDVCSVKLTPISIYQRTLPGHSNVVFAHPMFGPQSAANSLVGHTIIFCNQNIASKVVQKFCQEQLGLLVVSMTATEHDSVMANMHAITFFVARGLNNFGLKPSRFQAPSFQMLLDLVELDKAQSQELFETVENGNPKAQLVRQRLVEELSRLDSSISNHNM